jgi:enoyl-[acyl-carrier protein] reductase II
MLWLATAELAAAVSNAGALGTISPHAGMEKEGHPAENLRIQIARARDLTKKPFAINVPLDLEQSGIFIDIVLREKVKIVVTAAGNPELFTELLRKEGVKVLHIVSCVKQAQIAEACNVDGLIFLGF